MGSKPQNVKFIDNQLEFCSQKAVEESFAYLSHYSHNNPQPYEKKKANHLRLGFKLTLQCIGHTGLNTCIQLHIFFNLS